jgi:uncharacterized protein YjdB
VSVGTVKIFAVAADSSLSDTCTVTVVYASGDSIVLDKRTLAITLDSSVLLEATVFPNNANPTVVWGSSDEAVATVNNGVVKGISLGTVKIFATTVGGHSDTCIVTVYAKTDSVVLNSRDVTLILGNDTSLTAAVYPADANQAIMWSSSGEDIAAVNSSGVVTAVSVGTVKIFAVAADSSLSDSCTIKVVYANSDSIALDRTALTLYFGYADTLKTVYPDSADLTAAVFPNNADPTVVWGSSDAAVATVSGGTVAVVAAGTVKISAATVDGHSDTCIVTVYAKTDSVVLNKKDVRLELDSSVSLTATVYPPTSNQNVIWSSSGEDIAAVNDSGVVTAISVGMAKISVVTADGLNSDTCTVNTSYAAVDSITLNRDTLTLTKDSSFALAAFVMPTNASQSVMWSSSDTLTVIVDADGNVTAVNAGAAFIIASADDSLNSDSCAVTVLFADCDSIILDTNTLTLTKDSSFALMAFVIPSNADQTITWSSSDNSIATVDANGTVTAVDAGMAFIVAAAADSTYSDTCTVTVVYAGSKRVAFDQTAQTLIKDSSYVLTARVLPSNAAQGITWISKDTSIVTVDSGGKIVGVSVGLDPIQIIATAADGNQAGVCFVTVVYAASDSIILDTAALTLTLDSSFALTAVVMPTNANQTLNWSSSNSLVAAVDDGRVTGVSVGMASIIAVVADGNYHFKICHVTVVHAASKSIDVDSSTLMLIKDSSFALTAVVMPTNADQMITWRSSDPLIVTVDAKGIITGVSTGTAKIYASTADGLNADTVTVTVYVKSESIIVDKDSLMLIKDSSAALTAAVTPFDTDKTVTWSSSDESVARVSDSGVVTGMSGGTVFIVASTADRLHSDTCVVTVEYAESDSVSIDKEIPILIKDSSFALTAVVMPTNADQTVTWNSSNEAVAAVDSSGVVTALSVGTARISAVTVNGLYSDTCTVMVEYANSDSININKKTLTLTKDSSAVFTAVVMPANADRTVIWSSSDASIATVDTGGKVVALSVGTVSVIAAAGDGFNFDTCIVTVVYAASSGITLNRDTLTLTKDSSAVFTTVVMPTNADPTVTWSSSDLSVATVGADGRVTAVDTGRALIIAATVDNNYSDTCAVKVVYADNKSVSLNKEAITLTLDSSFVLTAEVVPTNADQAVTWKSNNTSIAVIDPDGKVTGVSVGTVFVVASTVDGKQSEECHVTVIYANSDSVNIDKKSLTLILDSSAVLTATVLPTNADRSVTWSSSDTSIATVDTGGKVVALSVGTVSVIAAAGDGFNFDTCTVTVVPPPNGDTVLHNITILADHGGDLELKPAFDPNIYQYIVLLPCPAEDEALCMDVDYPDSNAVTFGGEADADGVVTIDKDEAGDHTATVTLTLPDSAAKIYTVTFRQRASSELLFHLWDDMIIVNLNKETNGGYEFTDFKWYLNNELTGDTGRYLLAENGLAVGGKYHLELTTSNGETLETCPYSYAVPQNAAVRIYPNPVTTGSILTIEIDMPEMRKGIRKAQKALFYDVAGQLLQTYSLQVGQKILQLPVTLPYGIYTVRIGNETRKFIVVE